MKFSSTISAFHRWENLYAARYPAQEQGMDKESAIMSFLAYAREKIHAPISIDIYGANGWYRTGARTGQEVEVLADYVDVICPMFYPSHFRQSFLAQQPAEERPYRIYQQGSYRNKIIAHNKVIIRPWTQAFYIPVSYDKSIIMKIMCSGRLSALRIPLMKAMPIGIIPAVTPTSARRPPLPK